MKKYETAILILNWKQPDETIRCVKDLIAGGLKDQLLVIVDNGSGDNSFLEIYDYLAGLSNLTKIETTESKGEADIRMFVGADNSEIFILSFSANAGFAGGMNRAINFASGFDVAAYFLLNNDAEISTENIRRLKQISQEHGDALVGPIVCDYFDRDKVVFKGKKWPDILFGFDRVPEGAHQEIWRTGYVEGSALLLPRAFVEKMIQADGSCFDDRYFLYCEDVDLCLKANKMGFQCLMTSNVKAYHKISISTGGLGNISAYYYITRNRLLLARKWLPLPLLPIFYAYHICTRFILNIRRLPTSQGRAIVWSVFHGLWDGILGNFGKKSAG